MQLSGHSHRAACPSLSGSCRHICQSFRHSGVQRQTQALRTAALTERQEPHLKGSLLCSLTQRFLRPPALKRRALLKLAVSRATKTKGSESDTGTQQDSSLPFVALAVVYAALGAFLFAAPHTAADAAFGTAAGPHDYLHEVLFQLLAIFFELVALQNLNQKYAAGEGRLGEAISVRGSASLASFAGVCLGLTGLSFVMTPIVTPAAGAAFGLLSGAQLLIALRAYAKYSPGGANPIAMLGGYAKDLTQLAKIDGLNSGLYSMFTATFIGIGLGFLFAPNLTASGMFSLDGRLGLEDQFLWELLGGVIAAIVGPVCYTQQEAAIQNNFSQRPKRLMMGGLALASGAYTFTLLPLLFTDKAGSLLFWAGFPFGTLAVASTLIAVKPKENPQWYTPW